MDTKPKLTKQGIKDLNHYGPKPTRAVAAASGPAGDETVKTSPPAVDEKPDAPVSVGT